MAHFVFCFSNVFWFCYTSVLLKYIGSYSRARLSTIHTWHKPKKLVKSAHAVHTLTLRITTHPLGHCTSAPLTSLLFFHWLSMLPHYGLCIEAPFSKWLTLGPFKLRCHRPFPLRIALTNPSNTVNSPPTVHSQSHVSAVFFPIALNTYEHIT